MKLCKIAIIGMVLMSLGSAFTITTDKEIYTCWMDKCEPVQVTLNNDKAGYYTIKINMETLKDGIFISAKLPYLATTLDKLVTTESIYLPVGKTIFKLDVAARPDLKFSINAYDSIGKLVASLDPWFMDLFTNRLNITIDNAGAPLLTDYPFQMNISYVTNMSADFSNLLFTSSDGLLNLSHYIEKKVNSNYALLSVNTTIAADSETIIWMYFGNISAFSSYANGYRVYPVFDDAEADHLSDWLFAGGWVNPLVERLYNGSQYVLNLSQDSGNNGEIYKAIDFFQNFSASFKTMAPVEAQYGAQLFLDTPGDELSGIGTWLRGGSQDTYGYDWDETTGWMSNATTVTPAVWYSMEVRQIYTTMYVLVNGVNKGSYVHTTAADPIGFGGYGHVLRYFDDIIVRPLAADEPTYIINSSQTGSAPVVDWLNISWGLPLVYNVTDSHVVNFSMDTAGSEDYINCSLRINNSVYGNTSAVINGSAVSWALTLVNASYLVNMSCYSTTLYNSTANNVIILMVPSAAPGSAIIMPPSGDWTYSVCVDNDTEYHERVTTLNDESYNYSEQLTCKNGCDPNTGQCNADIYASYLNLGYLFIGILAALCLLLYINKNSKRIF